MPLLRPAGRGLQGCVRRLHATPVAPIAKEGSSYDPYNCITSVLDEKVSPESGPLHGWSVSVKENICIANQPAPCSSRMLLDFVPPFDATVVDRLRRAGAVISSQTNCDEFAMGGFNKHSVHGPVKNPFLYLNNAGILPQDLRPRTAGGSSGGAAASVAAGLCRVAVGSDTGGSVRLPAAFCGVFGLKPSYGAISRWGLISYADSLDTIGVLGRSGSDLDEVFQVVSLEDYRDATCAHTALRDASRQAVESVFNRLQPTTEKPLIGLRVGVPVELFPEELDPRVGDIVDDYLGMLHEQGASIVSVSLPMLKESLGCYYLLALSEASSNLSRYDGVRYGLYFSSEFLLLTLPGYEAPEGNEGPKSHHERVANNRSAGFGAEVQRRILLGSYTLSAEAWESHFIKAVSVRSALTQEFNTKWTTGDVRFTDSLDNHADKQRVDLMLFPTNLGPAPYLDDDAAGEYAQDVLTAPANLAGLPVLNTPASKLLEEPDGACLPVGLSFMGPWGHERLLFHVVRTLEQEGAFLGIK